MKKSGMSVVTTKWGSHPNIMVTSTGTGSGSTMKDKDLARKKPEKTPRDVKTLCGFSKAKARRIIKKAGLKFSTSVKKSMLFNLVIVRRPGMHT